MKSYLLIVAVVGFVASVPIEVPVKNASELATFAVGDILITSRQRSILYPKNTKVRNGLRKSSEIWPNGKVYYTFSQSIPDNHKELIAEAFGEIENSTCVRFEEVTESAENFIRIANNGYNCNSALGYYARAGQQMNLGAGCMHKGIILHETLHALGFFHQQNSPDRDDHIIVFEKNIIPANLPNFDRLNDTEVTGFGFPYDYKSILHYGIFDFTSNGRPVMAALVPGMDDVMGQRDALSEIDIAKINKMYNCP